jgi:lipopolysaccharide assembly outer membrane protein LptD (OstA)
MKKLFQFSVLILMGWSTLVPAQDLPVDIRSRGEKRFEGGVATAEDNVVIEYGDTTIYADRAVYNPSTQEVFLEGRVRIYREDFNFTGERALYNFETQQVLASDFSGSTGPLFFTTGTFDTISATEFHLLDGEFTTDDNFDPDFTLRADKTRVYTDDRVVMEKVTLHVGETPVFWYPLLYQSLKEDIGFSFSPGYNGNSTAFSGSTSAQNAAWPGAWMCFIAP